MNSKKSLCVLLLLCLPGGLPAGETAAVLSAGTGAYMEAFSAFQAAYGSEVPYTDLSMGKPNLSASTRTVVAFGGKAAEYAYPDGMRLIYCLAPGVLLNKSPERSGKAVKISLIPGLVEVLVKIKTIQPKIKRLKVFWTLPLFKSYSEALKTEGARLGMEVTALRVESGAALPALLRREMEGMEAFWLPPDPMLITPENLLIFKGVSWANGIPFYGSTKGMTRDGAIASIGVSFREMGIFAAAAARRLENGEDLPEIMFPGKAEITLNASAAKKCGVEFPQSVIEEAAYFFP